MKFFLGNTDDYFQDKAFIPEAALLHLYIGWGAQ